MADHPPAAGRLIATVTAVLLALAAIVAPSSEIRATGPDEVLAEPALEARAREIGRELRCLVCQNQSIDDSDADLARDLRSLVRARVKAGDSDRQVIDYVVSRYGDFVLMRPPFKPSTWALWFGPAVFLGAGGIALAVYFRRRRTVPDTAQGVALAEDEEIQVARLLKDGPA